MMTEEEVSDIIQVKDFERKPSKAIGMAGLEVRKEHIYPEVENREVLSDLPSPTIGQNN